jgi:hypothetical protein
MLGKRLCLECRGCPANSTPAATLGTGLQMFAHEARSWVAALPTRWSRSRRRDVSLRHRGDPIERKKLFDAPMALAPDGSQASPNARAVASDGGKAHTYYAKVAHHAGEVAQQRWHRPANAGALPLAPLPPSPRTPGPRNQGLAMGRPRDRRNPLRAPRPGGSGAALQGNGGPRAAFPWSLRCCSMGLIHPRTARSRLQASRCPPGSPPSGLTGDGDAHGQDHKTNRADAPSARPDTFLSAN